ncbi:MAG: hypothetical protein JW747_10110 [Candidatus Aminicenantes bacterium]|nr:hypothetical protein [Candidatus Aminicenantes bacterium]
MRSHRPLTVLLGIPALGLPLSWAGHQTAAPQARGQALLEAMQGIRSEVFFDPVREMIADKYGGRSYYRVTKDGPSAINPETLEDVARLPSMAVMDMDAAERLDFRPPAN